MKKTRKHTQFIYIFLLIGLQLISCDSGDPGLCFNANEPLTLQEREVSDFTRIRTNQNILLILKEGEQSIQIEAKESIISDISVQVIDGELLLEDDNRCDFLNPSSPTTIYVSAPNITDIRNASQFEVRSDGILSYNQLTLVSDNLEGATFSIGDFRLILDVQEFQVITANSSSYFISGAAEKANIGFFNGLGRFEGGDFLVNELSIFHRGSNQMIVHPVHSIQGTIVSTGDVISRNIPPIINIEELFEGRLLFE